MNGTIRILGVLGIVATARGAAEPEMTHARKLYDLNELLTSRSRESPRWDF